MNHRDEFDQTIGQLDRVLSKLVNWGRGVQRVKANSFSSEACIDEPDQQTLKHHAEDMIAAGQKILKDLGHEVEGTPQPKMYTGILRGVPFTSEEYIASREFVAPLPEGGVAIPSNAVVAPADEKYGTYIPDSSRN